MDRKGINIDTFQITGDTTQIKIFHICRVYKEGSVTIGFNHKTKGQYMGILLQDKGKNESKLPYRNYYILCS